MMKLKPRYILVLLLSAFTFMPVMAQTEGGAEQTEPVIL